MTKMTVPGAKKSLENIMVSSLTTNWHENPVEHLDARRERSRHSDSVDVSATPRKPTIDQIPRQFSESLPGDSVPRVIACHLEDDQFVRYEIISPRTKQGCLRLSTGLSDNFQCDATTESKPGTCKYSDDEDSSAVLDLDPNSATQEQPREFTMGTDAIGKSSTVLPRHLYRTLNTNSWSAEDSGQVVPTAPTDQPLEFSGLVETEYTANSGTRELTSSNSDSMGATNVIQGLVSSLQRMAISASVQEKGLQSQRKRIQCSNEHERRGTNKLFAVNPNTSTTTHMVKEQEENLSSISDSFETSSTSFRARSFRAKHSRVLIDNQSHSGDGSTHRDSEHRERTKYQPVTLGRKEVTGRSSWSSSNGEQTTTTSSKNISEKQPEKRKRNDGHEDDGNAPARKRDVDMSVGSQARKLACPFHKSDPEKYRRSSKSHDKKYKTCTRGFHNIKDLKDHLRTVHMPKHFCRRCSMTFTSEELLEGHQRQDKICQCQDTSDFKIEFIVTEERYQRVLVKKSPTVTIEEHWMEMWRNLFPGRNPPSSPYQSISSIESIWDEVESRTLELAPAIFTEKLEIGEDREMMLQEVLRQVLDIQRSIFLQDTQQHQELQEFVSEGSRKLIDSVPKVTKTLFAIGDPGQPQDPHNLPQALPATTRYSSLTEDAETPCSSFNPRQLGENQQGDYQMPFNGQPSSDLLDTDPLHGTYEQIQTPVSSTYNPSDTVSMFVNPRDMYLHGSGQYQNAYSGQSRQAMDSSSYTPNLVLAHGRQGKTIFTAVTQPSESDQACMAIPWSVYNGQDQVPINDFNQQHEFSNTFIPPRTNSFGAPLSGGMQASTSAAAVNQFYYPSLPQSFPSYQSPSPF